MVGTLDLGVGSFVHKCICDDDESFSDKESPGALLASQFLEQVRMAYLDPINHWPCKKSPPEP